VEERPEHLVQFRLMILRERPRIIRGGLQPNRDLARLPPDIITHSRLPKPTTLQYFGLPNVTEP